MKKIREIKLVTLGERVTLEEFIAVARYGAQVQFSDKYSDRVNKSRVLVEEWVDQEKIIYGVTTGFGALCNKTISKNEVAQLQKNIILSHATAVGQPFTKEEARGLIFMILQNLGQGFSGVRLCILEFLRDLLNKDVTPYIPKEGSVGYLCAEAHLALILIGQGRGYFKGEFLEGEELLKKIELSPIELASKEGLALISGTTSTTALGALALWDMLKASKAADIIAATTLEASRGLIRAFDKRVMEIRPHNDQAKTASNIRRLLEDSMVIEDSKQDRLQDPLSLRCIPQLHGAAKKTLYDAKIVIETEMNSCCDNPIIWSDGITSDAISACNADSAYVGMEMDSASIASTMLAKMSERRNNHMVDGYLSNKPAFLIKNPGLNSGLMISQYTQVGLLGDMRILSTPSVIDNTPTCMNQEDYVGMGYNSSKKAIAVVEKLEYILAIELLGAYMSQWFLDENLKLSKTTACISEHLSKHIQKSDEDFLLYPHIEYLKDIIHSGELVDWAEEKIGELE